MVRELLPLEALYRLKLLAAKPRPDAALAAVADALAALNPDDLSPREALEALYRLKLLAARKDG
jgi:DNA mismatch repair protein MutS